jgi:energy-coupling factor transporter ATP-binding protein EcfA2
VRVAHGVGVAFRWRIETGPDSVPLLIVQAPISARWVQRELSAAYGPTGWIAAALPPATGPSALRWDGAPARAWPEPLRVPGEEPPLFDVLVGTLRSLPVGAALDWRVAPAPLGRPPPAPRIEPLYGPGSVRSMPTRSSPTSRPFPAPPVEQSPLWESRCRIETGPTGGDRVDLRLIARALESATRSVGGNMLRFRPVRWWTPGGAVRFPLAEAEAISLLPSPYGVELRAADTDPTGGGWRLPLGRRSDGRVAGPWVEPEQGRHLAVLGETGMGKSSLLVALARRTVRSAGLVLLDPLGETALDLYRTLGPVDRARVTWIAPTGGIRINALEGLAAPSSGTDPRAERMRNDLVHALRRVRSGRYSDASFWGPRLEEMLTRAVSAAALLPRGTLVEAHALLAAEGRGFRVVPPGAGEAVRALADRIRLRPEDADGARRLLFEVVGSPVLVRSLCADDPTHRVADLVAPGRIVVLSGCAATVGESIARYFLSVYLALLWAELLARPLPSKMFVVLDEAQWFVHESLAEMLRLGRRGNVHVVLATQALASLPEAVAEAAWTNVSDFVAFRGSPEEAREFSRIARGIRPESLLSLRRGEAALLLGKGGTVEWLRTVRVPRPHEGAPPPATLLPDASGAPTLDPGAARLPEPRGSSERSATSPADSVLAVVGRRVEGHGEGDLVRISLDELRREVDPTGQGVREAGGRLGRLGVIARVDRDEVGACWWIDPARWKARAPPAASPGNSGPDATASPPF